MKQWLGLFRPDNPGTLGAKRKALMTLLSLSELSSGKQQQGVEHDGMMDMSLEDEKV